MKSKQGDNIMIVDSLKNFKLYCHCIPGYELIQNFLQKQNLNDLKNGEHEIDGRDLYVSVNEYNTQIDAAVRLEAHSRYIDCQVIISGSEFIRTAITEELQLSEPYKESCDAAFYSSIEPTGTILLKTGHFAVFFPQDAHQPCLSDNDSSKAVRKLVFKIRIKN
jgi:YhcH/YjgK/YiaL family protein